MLRISSSILCSVSKYTSAGLWACFVTFGDQVWVLAAEYFLANFLGFLNKHLKEFSEVCARRLMNHEKNQIWKKRKIWWIEYMFLLAFKFCFFSHSLQRLNWWLFSSEKVCVDFNPPKYLFSTTNAQQRQKKC